MLADRDARMVGVNFSALNTAIVSPRGFLAHLVDPDATIRVSAGSVWGFGDLADLRQYAYVTVGPVPIAPIAPDVGESAGEVGDSGDGQIAPDGSVQPGAGMAPDEAHAATVVTLLLAGVPVATGELPEPVRELLDTELLDLADTVTAEQVRDAGRREVLSLALRRRAWAVTRPPVMQDPADNPVLAIIPEEPTEDLRQDLAAQTWPVAQTVTDDQPDLDTRVEQAARHGTVYVTRLDPALRYGPHHLGDLVQAIRHSRARVVHSPARFETIGNGRWLERDDGRCEATGSAGLPGGSLWYAADGPSLPQPDRGDYLINGANAVPAAGTGGTAPLVASGALPPAPSRLHRKRPAVLDWLGSTDPVGTVGEPEASLPSSYFAAAGTGAPSRLRNSATARDS